jgi:phosphate-selective porin OprO/OprP
MRVVALFACLLVLSSFPCSTLASDTEADSPSEEQALPLQGPSSETPAPSQETPSKEAAKSRRSYFRLYWKDGLIYEVGRRFEGLEKEDISQAFKKAKLNGRIGGKLDLDGALFIERKGLSGFDNGVQVRRARIYTKGEFLLLVPATFNVEFGIAGRQFVWNNFYLQFNRDKYVDYFGKHQEKPSRNYIGLDNIQLGVFSPPMGLEATGSAEDSTFLEYASPSDAFTPSDRLGIQAAGSAWKKRLSWTLGIFSVTTDKDTGDASKSIGRGIGRITLLPWLDERGDSPRYLHLGLSGSYVYSGTEEIRYQSRPESHLAPEVVDTGEIESKKAFLYGFEGALIYGAYSLQAEYLHSRVDDHSGNRLNFGGFYVYGSWVITGESRPYDRATGTLGRIHPKKDFSLKKGTWGAWEVGVRLSHIDLDDRPVQGGRMNILTGGLNWSLNPHIRVMFNYLRQNISGGPEYDGLAHTFTLRLQFYI